MGILVWVSQYHSEGAGPPSYLESLGENLLPGAFRFLAEFSLVQL